MCCYLFAQELRVSLRARDVFHPRVFSVFYIKQNETNLGIIASVDAKKKNKQTKNTTYENILKQPKYQKGEAFDQLMSTA